MTESVIGWNYGGRPRFVRVVSRKRYGCTYMKNIPRHIPVDVYQFYLDSDQLTPTPYGRMVEFEVAQTTPPTIMVMPFADLLTREARRNFGHTYIHHTDDMMFPMLVYHPKYIPGRLRWSGWHRGAMVEFIGRRIVEPFIDASCDP